jgi:hypothetical protein
LRNNLNAAPSYPPQRYKMLLTQELKPRLARQTSMKADKRSVKRGIVPSFGVNRSGKWAWRNVNMGWEA